ncbi:serine hydrolase domain-containing protein [Flavobacterium sp. RHBU_24]|uniref:serine hydrolase domain-containing protein n=1 Tax=Flavobacterium sp. RHBU_24 TaxID=3391185 RepID=UPI003984696D
MKILKMPVQPKHENIVMKTIALLLLFLSSILVSYGQDFSAAAEKADKQCARFLGKNNIPGLSISISYADKLVYSKGFGYADVAAGLAVNPQSSQFRIGSITKPLVALTLARLQEQHRLSLDESVYKYADSLPKKEYDFTIRQVGSHVAGLKRMYMPYNNDSTKVTTREEFYDAFTEPLLFKPGTDNSYSNFGYEILGLVIEKATGEPLDKVIAQQVLNPLAMGHTLPARLKESNTKYYSGNEGGNFLPAQHMAYNLNTAPGYYYSTSEDLVKLGNALLIPGRLLQKNTLLDIIKPYPLSSGKNNHDGFGVENDNGINGKRMIGHTGHVFGGTAAFIVYPEYKLVIAFTANCDHIKPEKSLAFLSEITKAFVDEID